MKKLRGRTTKSSRMSKKSVKKKLEKTRTKKKKFSKTIRIIL